MYSQVTDAFTPGAYRHGEPLTLCGAVHGLRPEYGICPKAFVTPNRDGHVSGQLLSPARQPHEAGQNWDSGLMGYQKPF